MVTKNITVIKHRDNEHLRPTLKLFVFIFFFKNCENSHLSTPHWFFSLWRSLRLFLAQMILEKSFTKLLMSDCDNSRSAVNGIIREKKKETVPIIFFWLIFLKKIFFGLLFGFCVKVIWGFSCRDFLRQLFIFWKMIEIVAVKTETVFFIQLFSNVSNKCF